MKNEEQKELVSVSIGELDGTAGLKPLKTLLDRLTEKYPERMYSSLYKYLDTHHFTEPNVTLVATINGEIAGVLSGRRTDNKFLGDYLFVDPKFSSHSVGHKLLQTIFAKYISFELDPTPLSYSPGFDPDSSPDIREKALRRYYHRLGFIDIPASRRMIWQKK